jgi:hypothetical protein
MSSWVDASSPCDSNEGNGAANGDVLGEDRRARPWLGHVGGGAWESAETVLWARIDDEKQRGWYSWCRCRLQVPSRSGGNGRTEVIEAALRALASGSGDGCYNWWRCSEGERARAGCLVVERRIPALDFIDSRTMNADGIGAPFTVMNGGRWFQHAVVWWREWRGALLWGFDGTRLMGVLDCRGGRRPRRTWTAPWPAGWPVGHGGQRRR